MSKLINCFTLFSHSRLEWVMILVQSGFYCVNLSMDNGCLSVASCFCPFVCFALNARRCLGIVVGRMSRCVSAGFISTPLIPASIVFPMTPAYFRGRRSLALWRICNPRGIIWAMHGRWPYCRRSYALSSPHTLPDGHRRLTPPPAQPQSYTAPQPQLNLSETHITIPNVLCMYLCTLQYKNN